MAVPIHGSMDQGPLILGDGLRELSVLTIETDPIFSAWDKHSGISITQSQISDGSSIVKTTDLSSISINTSGTLLSVNVQGSTSGLNTGDQDLTGLVPYTGAVQDVDFGQHFIAADGITINNSPVNPTDGATKGYVDTFLTTGIIWDSPVLDIVTTLPGGATLGDRYIHDTDDKINEWDGASWIVTTPSSGVALYVEGDVDAPTNNVGLYTYNGTSWVYIGSSIKHNDTTDIQGGSAGNYWHLDIPTFSSVGVLTTITADIVPTGLSILYSGLNIALDGTQTAYVTLTWNAIATSTFDHYVIRYKRSSFTYYQTLISYSNIITIEGLLPNTSYDFGVCSVNKYGTSSAYSGNVTSTTTADSTPPATVSGITATGGIQCILLEWTHNTDLDLTSYNIYRNTVNNSATAGLIFNITGNRMTDSPLPVSTTYYYWIKAEDTSGNLSTSFSAEAHATTSQVVSSDIESISANKVLITGTTYLSSWNSIGSTKIDGAKIDTGTVTLTQLNFVPIVGGSIIASINASPEGIQIDADNFAVSGSSVFTQKIGGTYTTSATAAARVQIFPDSDTGIQITDDLSHDVFKVNIGGTNIGDVILGNVAGGEGVWYDKSAGTTTFYGVLEATAGHIGGWGIDAEAIFTGTKYTSDGYSANGLTMAGDGSIHSKNFYINADGTSSIAGSLPHTVRKAASGVLRHSSAAEVSAAHPLYTDTPAKVITFTNGLLGTAAYAFDIKKVTVSGSDIAKVRLYRNGVALGTEWTATTGYITENQTITQDWGTGDTCEVRWYATSGTTVYVRNFAISYSDDPIVTVAATGCINY